MTAYTLDPRGIRAPAWLWAMAALGVLWNLYGIYQFVGTLTPEGRSAMAAGMTAAQAQIYFSLPGWMTAGFAVGVFGGLLGSMALLVRPGMALPVLATSLAGYVALFAGDVHFGVFDALPGQLAILVLVLVVAAVLFATAWVARARALPR
ncbi:hypothetical protein [Sphaerotilus mobilis]|uniref:DoxX-like protein n=1 Tax=Sphaerotilus mobilis TaxID=47994 RepID=A0A4Q7LJZ1_9BURK|nr:hypothetical protein [Sphaerotilus mobilis]RZS54946.1 hypothetical protein EV685_2432 [Sphaerotilus mobilis]